MSAPSIRDLPGHAEPAWDVARLFPLQGGWSEEEYLALPGTCLAEFDQGRIEVLDMPSELHQFLVLFLYEALSAHVRSRKLGRVAVAPLPVKLWDGKFREPDVLFMAAEHADRRRGSHWEGADLVMEVLSPNDPARDRDTKRLEFARAGIPEFWLVDPAARTVSVHALPTGADAYEVQGIYVEGRRAESASLTGFGMDVVELFKAGED
jgi:Uma2 family endonuclease